MYQIFDKFIQLKTDTYEYEQLVNYKIMKVACSLTFSELKLQHDMNGDVS